MPETKLDAKELERAIGVAQGYLGSHRFHLPQPHPCDGCCMSRVLLALAEARDEPQPWVLALIELAEEVATDTNPANVHAHAVFAKQALADVPEALRRVAEGR